MLSVRWVIRTIFCFFQYNQNSFISLCRNTFTKMELSRSQIVIFWLLARQVQTVLAVQPTAVQLTSVMVVFLFRVLSHWHLLSLSLLVCLKQLWLIENNVLIQRNWTKNHIFHSFSVWSFVFHFSFLNLGTDCTCWYLFDL
jgi:hypothetical protein